MEEDQGKLADMARRTGLTEHEARILYHLDTAAELYFELAEQEDYSPGTDTEAWNHHQQALVRLLMMRVARRDHPDGWLTIQEWEAQGSAEEGERGE